MQRPRGAVLAVLLVVLFLSASVQAADGEKNIRVGLLQDQQQIRVMCPGGFVAIDLGSGQLDEFPPNTAIVFSSEGAVIGAGLEGVYTGPVRLAGLNQEFLYLNGTSYRGELEVILKNGRLTVVNELPVEEYLYGVVPREMPASFPLEALKAQAVTARTFTYANWTKHAAEGFNLCGTVHCQVYGGAAAEAPQTNQAVDSTRGEVLRYEGRLIDACYHASSGGYTENSENVWSEWVPYLRGVPDYETDSPYSSWSISYSPEQLSEILRQGGVDVGRVKEITPLSRGVSGRVTQLRITGSRGSQVISGSQLRGILGYDQLRSTLFEVEMQTAGENIIRQPLRAEQEVTVIGGDGQKRKVAMSEVAVLGGDATVAVGIGQDVETGQVIFKGSGWGHGVGLSQWGAKAMAEMAPRGADNYYRTILQHYFQGAQIETI
ncbi:MAG TPA: SpoIID/LytB domain-containing protein [Firmicutes bacterium]|nr:SpoIID/LytB domain-containing protein [Bacillota bacterium]